MNASDILAAIEPLGAASYRKVLANHGIPEPMYGVKISDVKALLKQWKIKKDYQLALDLYAQPVYDGRYLAGLIADEKRMTADDLQRWVVTSDCASLSQNTVAWVTAESAYGLELARRWIESGSELVACSGWCTFGGVVALKQDNELELAELTALLRRVEETIHSAPNEVRYCMNSFVISVGSYVQPLTAEALRVGRAIGQVTVDMGNTACKVPFAPDYIAKVEARGTLGKKRK
ncbi:MAG: DNA alkylation repair protein, partial [Pseudohongiella sp.]|nr:DNA alkylation repair protein [Pseudohongiella sp.]